MLLNELFSELVGVWLPRNRDNDDVEEEKDDWRDDGVVLRSDDFFDRRGNEFRASSDTFNFMLNIVNTLTSLAIPEMNIYSVHKLIIFIIYANFSIYQHQSCPLQIER